MTPAQRERLNIPSGGEALVELALTHPSRRHQEGAGADNERLEFLGDAILGAVVASRLYADDTAAEEGDLSERRAAVVSRTALAEVALRIGPNLNPAPCGEKLCAQGLAVPPSDCAL